MPGPDLIDLKHQTERVVACYLLETDDGLALHDCGPSTCIPTLKAALAERGLELTDVRHLLLLHIHLAHAGARRSPPGPGPGAGAAAPPPASTRSGPGGGARRLYGDAFDPLWGELAPV